MGEVVLLSFPYIMLSLQRPHSQKDLSPDGQSSFPRGERTEPKEINFTSHMLLCGATEGLFQPFLFSDDRLTLLPELPTSREGSPWVQDAMWGATPFPPVILPFYPLVLTTAVSWSYHRGPPFWGVNCILFPTQQIKGSLKKKKKGFSTKSRKGQPSNIK